MGVSPTSPRTRKVALNGSAGAYVAIVATIPARRVEIVEDGAAAAQGIAYQLPDDNFTATYNVLAAFEPIVFGSEVAKGIGAGKILGWPTQKDPLGNTLANTPTTYCQARSFSATATTVIVREYP